MFLEKKEKNHILYNYFLVLDSQTSSSGISTINNVAELNTQQKSKGEFDPVEAARQIKNVIGIGQSQQQQQNIVPPKPLMDLKPILCDQQTGQQQKSNIMSSKSAGQNLNTKVTPPPPQQQQQQQQQQPGPPGQESQPTILWQCNL
jgi:hypothetical protein